MILSPVYDLMNTMLHIYNDKYPALNFGHDFERTYDNTGSDYKYDYMDFIMLGERLDLDENNVIDICNEFQPKKSDILSFVDNSMLSKKAKPL